jgi:hypothetical protein
VWDGQAFAELDRQLGRAGTGPKRMLDPAVANAVAETVRQAAAGRRICALRALVIMPNPAHLSITPAI